VSADAIQLLLDKQALYELLVRYCRAIDRADQELLLSCFHADAYDDHGTCKGSREDLLEYLLRGTMNLDLVPGPHQHAVTNVTLEVDGDVAFGETYIESRAMSHGELHTGLARYVDRFERRAGEWRISERRVILEHARPGFDVSDFPRGYRDHRDPSYERLTEQ